MKAHEKPLTKRILVIDDNVSIHQDFCKILMKQDAPSKDLEAMEAELFGTETQDMSTGEFEIDCAVQGREGLNMVKNAIAQGRPYALAFVDGRMPPGWDGVETISHLWQEDPELQVVLCTAYSDCSWKDIRRLLGDTDGFLILKKPFDNVEVLQMAHALTRKWELNREVQGRLNKLAFYDGLTDLPNRTLFHEQLTKVLDKAHRCKHKAALLFIDLDNFKRINDTLGHSVGDELLKTTAGRLLKCIRTSDGSARPANGEMAARLGGDEFTVILPELAREDDAGIVARRIAEHVAQPMQLGKHRIHVTPSIGIAIYPQDGDTMDALLKHADIAMYFSKRMGPNMFSYYQESMNSTALKRMTIENHLRQAFERKEFSLYYQPQFCLATQRITGVEALLRWHNWELGDVPPLEFIPIAEETGCILNIGEWVMREACRQTKIWMDKGLPLGRIAVNVSGKQFMHPNFLETVQSILADTGLEPRFLEIELAEKFIMKDAQELAVILQALKKMNIRIAVDDFGIGYASLNLLENRSLDCLKIDGSFIQDINEKKDENGGKTSKSIISAIMAMAEGMDLRVIAEGIETKGQIEYLREKQCSEGQGYLLSRPMSSRQLEVFLQKGFSSEKDSGHTACDPAQ